MYWYKHFCHVRIKDTTLPNLQTTYFIILTLCDLAELRTDHFLFIYQSVFFFLLDKLLLHFNSRFLMLMPHRDPPYMSWSNGVLPSILLFLLTASDRGSESESGSTSKKSNSCSQIFPPSRLSMSSGKAIVAMLYGQMYKCDAASLLLLYPL